MVFWDTFGKPKMCDFAIFLKMSEQTCLLVPLNIGIHEQAAVSYLLLIADAFMKKTRAR